MKLLIDTMNLEEIKRCNDHYKIDGVTSNPTLIAKNRKMDFLKLFDEIKNIIGNKELHVQVSGETWQEMLADAVAITKHIDPKAYVKIPASREGIRAIKEVKAKDINVTATVVYSVQQAFVAAITGADYVAPYYNRMNNLNVDSAKVISEIAMIFQSNNIDTDIIAASFKNTQQIMDALLAGSTAITVPVDLLDEMVTNPVIESVNDKFRSDWVSVYGPTTIEKLTLDK